MTDTAPSNAILTVPNLVSIARLAAIPVFLWLLLGRDRSDLAGWLLLAIGGTDWVDGALARKLNQVSVLGQRLDPIADRVAIVAAVIGGWIAGIVPAGLIVPLLVRETMMAAVALWLFVSGRGVLEVRFLGKVATFLIYGAIPSFYVAAAGLASGFFRGLGWLAGFVGLVLYWWVAIVYLADAGAKLRQPVGQSQ